MLFLHKGAQGAIEYAVYTGSRPKESEGLYDLVKDVNCVWPAVNELMTRLGIPSMHKEMMFAVLNRWIIRTKYDEEKKTIYERMENDGMLERKKAEILAEWRFYNNYVDLVLALYGEVLAQKNLARENGVAEQILASKKICAIIRKIAQGISVYAEHEQMKLNQQLGTSVKTLDDLLKGKYQPLRQELTWNEWKKNIHELTTAQLVPFLYDITMSFKKVLDWKEVPMAEGKITKDNMRVNVSTPEEEFYWTARARWAEVPIWAGPSYTAHLMLLVARNAGAEQCEFQAFAYAIYAYWNKIYPHTATPIHRMFEVMTTAREFGVNAEACDPTKMYGEAEKFCM